MVDRLDWRIRPFVRDVSIIRTNGRYLPGIELAALRLETILRVVRRGKYIVFECGSGTLVCHNAMSGYWDTEDEPWTFDYVEGRRRPLSSDVRVTISADPVGPGMGKPVKLRFHDARLFGSLRYYPDGTRIPALERLGPDAMLSDEATLVGGIVDHPRRRRAIKDVVMDQRIIAGVGNIYATEALAAAGVDPNRPLERVVPETALSIVRHLRRIMGEQVRAGIDYGRLLVYRRSVCPSLHPVSSTKISGRTSYYCPECQR